MRMSTQGEVKGKDNAVQPMEKTKFGKIVLSEQEEAWLSKHFKHTKNEDCAKKLGISLRSVNRLAEARGLQKSRQFLKKCQEEAAAKANESNRINRTYPPKGYKIPRREEFQFKKGETNLERLGAKKEAERRINCAESRRKTFKLEKARALYGIPQQTKLKVVRRPRKQINMRYALRQRGYIIERGELVAYYNESTNRSMALENKPRTGFTFKQI